MAFVSAASVAISYTKHVTEWGFASIAAGTSLMKRVKDAWGDMMSDDFEDSLKHWLREIRLEKLDRSKFLTLYFTENDYE